MAPQWRGWGVLILVLMEWRKNKNFGFNVSVPVRFNPCSNGMKKELNNPLIVKYEYAVLILVLMEWRKNSVNAQEFYAVEKF